MSQFESILFIDFQQIHSEINALASIDRHHPLLPTLTELYSLNVSIKAIKGGVVFEPLKWQNTEITFNEIASQSIEMMVDSSIEDCISKMDPRIHSVQLYSSNPETLNTIRLKAEKASKTFHKKIDFIESDIPAAIADFKKQLCLIPAEKFLIRSRRRFDRKTKKEHWTGLDSLSSLMINDPVVHQDHGIGFFRGIQHLEISGIKNEFLLIEYQNSDRLYLPVYNINLIQKYHGSPDVTPDRLGSGEFIKAKNEARLSAKRLAINLLELYAKRAKTRGFIFSKPDDEYFKMVESFPFSETPDQSNAIEDVLDDMTSGKLMDRIICGDVGFGKTEIAIRAAFKAVLDKKQVAVLCPTTLLAFQHEQSFKSRLSDFGVIIESISRFKSKTQQKKILESLSSGKIDILIGTHRILSNDVVFRDLGLVIIDEEHRFGVEHKEKLRSISSSVSTLTLTATPIPRTLNMALSGLRDISLIQTPPNERLSIKTYICGFDEETLTNAIRLELHRGGQVFFVHNRIKDLDHYYDLIKKWVPESRPVIAHGQMDEKILEETILKFYSNAANILICTSIIESGIDLPNANTIIINNADRLGLAQLYQIRGRVGRGSQRAFAYLVVSDYSKLTDEAKKRLNTIERFVELGSGFSIATHDLEIRGGGNFLGPEQSGHVAAIGLEMYSQLLEEAIASLKGTNDDDLTSQKDPEIKIPFPCYFPDGYINSNSIKLLTYRKLSRCVSDSEVYELKNEISDRFGRLPKEANNLVELMRLKIFLKQYGVEALVVGPEKTSIKLSKKTPISLEKTIALATTRPDWLQITPDSKLVIKLAVSNIPSIQEELEKLFDYLK
jgi:transcription-repair coupling factor (superfamily II helicase)